MEVGKKTKIHKRPTTKKGGSRRGSGYAPAQKKACWKVLDGAYNSLCIDTLLHSNCRSPRFDSEEAFDNCDSSSDSR